MNNYNSKLESQQAFLEAFNLTVKDLDYLLKLFLRYGMTKGEAEYRSPANHIFLQGVCQNFQLTYDTWSSKMTPQLKKILHEKYPQLLIDSDKFMWE